MVKRILNEWGTLPPKGRFMIRAAVAAVGGALVAGYMEGTITDWDTLKGALIAVGLKLAMGLFTPEEPFVGWNKPDEVSIPEDSEIVETSST